MFHHAQEFRQYVIISVYEEDEQQINKNLRLVRISDVLDDADMI